jgi:hypothetical protein
MKDWKKYKMKKTEFGSIASDWDFIPSTMFCPKITDGTHDSPSHKMKVNI